jgi:hypothetical protein
MDLEMVVFEYTTESPTLLSEPGQRVGLTASLNSFASLGYRASWSSGGVIRNGYISTGHAGWPRGSTMFMRRSNNNVVTLGVLSEIWRSVFPAGPDDHSFITTDNVLIIPPTNVIAFTSPALHHTSVVIHAGAAQGYLVGKSGTATGWRDGMVYRTNVNVDYSPWTTGALKIVIRPAPNNTLWPFAGDGDSGGIVVALGPRPGPDEHPSHHTFRDVVGIVQGMSDLGNAAFVIPASTPGLRHNIWPY